MNIKYATVAALALATLPLAACNTGTAPSSSAPASTTAHAPTTAELKQQLVDTYKHAHDSVEATQNTYTDECGALMQDFIDEGLVNDGQSNFEITDTTITGNTGVVNTRDTDDGDTHTMRFVREDGQWRALCPRLRVAHKMLTGGEK